MGVGARHPAPARARADGSAQRLRRVAGRRLRRRPAGCARPQGWPACSAASSTGNLSIVTPLASLAGGFVAVVAILSGESPADARHGRPAAGGGRRPAWPRSRRRPRKRSSGRTRRPWWPGPPGPGKTRASSAGQGTGTPTQVGTPQARRTRATAGAGWALLSSALFAVVVFLLAEATALHPVALAAYGRLGTMVVLVPVALLLAGLRLPAAVWRGGAATPASSTPRRSSRWPRRSPSARSRWPPWSSSQGGTWRRFSATCCCTSGCRGCSTQASRFTCVAVTLFAIG